MTIFSFSDADMHSPFGGIFFVNVHFAFSRIYAKIVIYEDCFINPFSSSQ